MIVTTNYHAPSQMSLAVSDFIDGFKNWRVWWFLGTQDIRLQYRRSALGPLWITLSMAVTIYAMGFLYGKLFRLDLSSYYPHLALGILSWSLISSLINEGVNTFVDAEGFIKQMKQPYYTYIFRTITRLFLTYFHNIVVIIPIFFVLRIPITTSILFVPIAWVLIWINGVSYCTVLSILSTRFRDLKPIISSFMQVIFFLTPVIWSPTLLSERGQFFINFNPFAHFLNLLRAPFLGKMPSNLTLSVVLGITMFGVIVSFVVFTKYRSRISYWL